MAFVITLRLLSLLSLSSLFLSSSVHAICVPRNSTQVKPSAPPPKDLTASSPPPPPPPVKPSLIVGPALFQKSTPLVSSLQAVDDGLTKICGQTSNPVLCVTSLGPLLTGEVSPLTVFKAAVKFTSGVVKDALAEANKFSDDPSISATTASCIDTCKENFGSAIDDLQASIEAVDAHDVGRRDSVLSAVLTDLSTCSDSFSEMNLKSPFEELSSKLNKLASNCLAISQLLD